MIFFLIIFGAGIERLRSVAICFTAFCVSSTNEMEGIVGFGYTKRERMSVMD